MSTDKDTNNNTKPDNGATATEAEKEKGKPAADTAAKRSGDKRDKSGEPAAKGTAKPPAARSGKPGGRGPSPFWALLVVIALLVAVGAGAGSYYVGERLVETRQALETSQANLDERLGGLPEAQQRLQSRVERLGSDIDELEQQLESGVRSELETFDQRLNALHKLLQETVAPIKEPADIEHLLQIANDSLILQQDISTALAALRIADSRLRDIADPLFSETRRRLSDEINALESTPRPDIAGTAFAISSLQQDIEELPLESLRSPLDERTAPALTAVDAEPAEGWKAVLNDVWQALRSLVVIRRTEEPQGPLIAPELRVYLNQNLSLKLESARLALLSRDPESFNHQLEVVRGWLARYYDEGHPKVGAMLDRLDGFMELDIDPGMPDISGSLQALRDALEQRRKALLEDDNDNDSGQTS